MSTMYIPKYVHQDGDCFFKLKYDVAEEQVLDRVDFRIFILHGGRQQVKWDLSMKQLSMPWFSGDTTNVATSYHPTRHC